MLLGEIVANLASDVGTEGRPTKPNTHANTTKTMKRAFHFRFEVMFPFPSGRAQTTQPQACCRAGG